MAGQRLRVTVTPEVQHFEDPKFKASLGCTVRHQLNRDSHAMKTEVM